MGAKKPSAPEAPNPLDTAKASIDAQLQALPDILAAQQQYGGQFAEEELKLLEKYGPRSAEALKAQTDILHPETGKATDLLERYLSSDYLDPQMEEQFLASSRAATSARGLGESGFGALEEVRGLSDLRNQLKMQQLNVALSAAGYAPSAAQSASLSGIGQNRVVQNVEPSQIFGLTASNYGNLTSQYQGQLGYQSNMYSTNVNAVTDILGSAMAAIGSAGGGAAAASDERLKDNIRYVAEIGDLKLASWDWNDEAERIFGYTGKGFGLIAQDVPYATIEHESGYLMIDYSKVGV
jgi:hypothetical protein